MHAVYEVARENLAHLPHESSDLGSVPTFVPAFYSVERQFHLSLSCYTFFRYLFLLFLPSETASRGEAKKCQIFLAPLHMPMWYMLYRNYIAKALHAATTYVRRMLLGRILLHVLALLIARALARAQHRSQLRSYKISSNMYKIGSTLSPQADWIYYRSVSEKFLYVNP